ncbi:ribosomal protein S6 kinase delta-1 [Trichonephila clavata]|uniref:Ribosomal protein S6 kinase delta-1 n=1 Tax=Trichonephila clavata TaxID=2740835 RepID=A0A8X6L7Q8_TRICU|nr:ribosomal protein S6 kinase delta-1 [Trichonephila clavata]
MSKKAKDPWVRTIDVSDPVLHKKGYTLYKVTSKVFPKNSVEAVTEVVVWKRYNDFKKLHKALSTLHQGLYLKEPFPPFAKTRFFGRFDPDVIEERRQSALKLLQFAANCSPLFTSQVFVKFFEDSHYVEESKSVTEPLEHKTDNILQPQRVLPEILDPKQSEKESDNQDNENKDHVLSLGGIWQHHQIADAISLGSHGTDDDDDDHTTFTDDDSIASRPSLNLAEFDPLLQYNNDALGPNSQENLCNSWLLSALQSCSNADVERDLENILEFPTPFCDFEVPEDYTSNRSESHSANSMDIDIKENHFTFDCPPPVAEDSSDISEFDPLANKNSFDEEDSFSYDRFAMTPNSYKKETFKRPQYIVQASKFVGLAQEAEDNNQYKEAFEFYKKAIELLLHGFQKNKCPELKDIVRKKIVLYLMKAEELYETKLPKTNLNEKLTMVNPTWPASPVKFTNLQGSVQELSKYKVLGVLDKVLLVLDISTNTTFIVKTLYKSPSPQIRGAARIVPQNVPFVVKLYRIYETNYALFLILEYATGGRLWNYVDSFMQRSPLSPNNEGTCLYVEPKTKVELCNVYSGKKIEDESVSEVGNTINSVDSDLTPSEKCPSSYVALFKKYADTVEEENVSLAKYHKSPSLLSKSRKKSGVSASSEIQNDINEKMSLLQPPKNVRNRLSSSTGSLETTYTQKTSNIELLSAMDETVSRIPTKTHLPESCIVTWAAEIILALESLHNLGIIWMDFHPDNILLGAEGHILLTYQSQWNNVDFVISESAKENLFCAPEVGSLFPVTSDCDWWSLGAILFELLMGQSLVSCHPTGIKSHTILNFPNEISEDAKDFVSKLLQYNPSDRLGTNGTEEIKNHPIFRDIDWKALQR